MGYKNTLYWTSRGIGTISSNPNEYYIFSEEEFDILKKEREVFLLTEDLGCLVLGNYHSDGGISLVGYNYTNKYYYLFGEIEGGEYISSNIVDGEEFEKELTKINNKSTTDQYVHEKGFFLPKGLHYLDTSSAMHPILLMEGNRFIINKGATQNHLEEIIQLENNK